MLVWLGLNWDLVISTISITDRRICKFVALIDKFLLSAPYVTARYCAVIAGHVMSMSPVLDNLIRLKTRFLYKVIESRRSWDSRFNIGLYMIASLKYFSGKPISLVLIRELFCLIMLPFCLAIRTLATSPAGLLLWALMRCPIVCGLLAKQLRALPGENLRLYNLP